MSGRPAFHAPVPRIVTCHQPTYLPWAGLFHKLALADVIVLMDTVDYSRRGWQNRNRIKGPNGSFWLTVPLSSRGSASRRLCDIAIAPGVCATRTDWQRAHWTSLSQAYSQADHWRSYAPIFEDALLGHSWTSLVELNAHLLRRLAAALRIEVDFVRASELGWEGRKSRIVLDHCRRTSATVYVSGVNGHDYLREQEFLDRGISVFYQRYRGPVYQQRHGGFIPDLSVVDLLFNVGAESTAALLAGNATRKALLEALAASGAPAVLETVPGAPATADGVTVRVPSVRSAYV
ncbi:WbqC family protein [Streptacidiphilus sp. PB12-B1b]|uniref:WbqC family protein n=1 Tax=Streptacidiphilus sp. PB12-B1b TaxID=2705012 RepID=UPI0015F86D05|nr:WbqC family protein [Streptacidiphilus sp. PB12-B1b]QMU78271.1 WbqC family protein [Streptacidiphilus sp. PB12-B1b]